MSIFISVLIFGFLIFVHELGHFLLAKKQGMLIHEFSIGMGPKIYSFTKGNTKYSLRLLPIGGFVSIDGMGTDSEEENSFEKKSPLQRISVLAAGAIFNILTALILMIFVNIYSGYPTTIIDEVQPKSVSEVAGLKSGDQLLSINGNKINEFEDLSKIYELKSNVLNVVVKRDNTEKEFKLVFDNIKEGRNSFNLGFSAKKEIQVFRSIKDGTLSIIEMIKFIFNGLYELGTSWLPSNKSLENNQVDVTGPVGIVQYTSTVVKTGVRNILMVSIMLNLNIGLFNLLPIPALDGSRIFFILIEMFRGGKKINYKIENAIHALGMLLLLAFMVIITFKDVLAII